VAQRALHTRLHADATEAYDALHARVPDDLLAALKEAGVRDWRIWRDGRDVFHLVDCEDYAAMRDRLRDHPANLAWQAQVTPLQSTPDDYSGQDDGLPFVWSFADQWAESGARSEGSATGDLSAPAASSPEVKRSADPDGG
jgi:L-rhamnose mutarotase